MPHKAIAADAGVSKMTVYSHFGSKEGLFEAVVRERTERVMGGGAGVETLDPTQPERALLAVGEQFLMLTREEDVLGKFRSVYGAAGAQPEACRAFYRQGPGRLIDELATYLRRADAAGTLKVPHPQRAADLFLAMFMGDGHVRGLLMLDMPSARDNKALLREAVRVFMAAYAV
jgi:AcrR family transcriptional regulator